MIDENTWIQIVLVLATIFMAFVMWIKTSESNNLLRNEIKIRYRPILARMYMDIPDYDMEIGKEMKKITFRFINNGSLPAIKLKKQYYAEIKENGSSIERITSDDININGIDMPSLAPNESMGIDIPLTEKQTDEAWQSNKCHFGLVVFYHDDNGKEYFYRMEGYLDRGRVMLFNTTSMN